ncbi:hypothetical protein LTR99_003730 [Exophiala xenobiotica]|uniref:Uncharacterized protein n=1 Tax=Vermiconidia calcicola TaxID=1690605 RepID=A0AAV9PZ13_9PEZI|nr:hypothetical protein LTR99_003730 [Exophiala xenobiotica]KAK5435198.1 hypothetical protein LTR34_002701 [Exophiala xenobiotica]KAK5531423.1 hypothetical protein LTR25_008532 [Vermiconidia calcicola]
MQANAQLSQKILSRKSHVCDKQRYETMPFAAKESSTWPSFTVLLSQPWRGLRIVDVVHIVYHFRSEYGCTSIVQTWPSVHGNPTAPDEVVVPLSSLALTEMERIAKVVAASLTIAFRSMESNVEGNIVV